MSPSSDFLEATSWLQENCIGAYFTVASTLKVGTTEADIALAVKEELRSKGVTDFWYDIPVMVLFGKDRFSHMTEESYSVKQPQEEVLLQEGDTFFIDIHPRHESGRWGNFAATGVYRPQDEETVFFLKLMQQIQNEAIKSLVPTMAGKDVANWFVRRFHEEQIELLDVRGNFGHSMGSGIKSSYQRLFLDEENNLPIGGEIYGIEPGGIKQSKVNVLVARFEDCVYIPLDGGQAVILGRQSPIPIVWQNR